MNSKTVVVCDSQPLVAEGLRSLLSRCEDLRYAGAITTLAGGAELVRSLRPAVVLIDKTFGLQAVADWLADLKLQEKSCAVVWGAGISNSEALKLVQAGAQGIIQKTADGETLLSCLRAVTQGQTWMEDTIFSMNGLTDRSGRSPLTCRENQVVELVEKGLRNKDIAGQLGIQTGTVKIHLKHIFEKTGCRGRYGLALSGLREKGQIQLSM